MKFGHSNGQPGTVYVAKASDGLYKIGMTRRSVPKERILALTRSAGHGPLEVVRAFSVRNRSLVEYRLHQRFRARQVASEWFSLTAEDEAAIRSMTDADIEALHDESLGVKMRSAESLIGRLASLELPPLLVQLMLATALGVSTEAFRDR